MCIHQSMYFLTILALTGPCLRRRRDEGDTAPVLPSTRIFIMLHDANSQKVLMAVSVPNTPKLFGPSLSSSAGIYLTPRVMCTLDWLDGIIRIWSWGEGGSGLPTYIG